MDIVQIAQALAALPIHALLLLFVLVLWREVRRSNAKLEKCLSEHDAVLVKLIARMTNIEHHGGNSK